jgi:hypothetical protein
LVLTALRVKSFAPVETVAAAAGLDVDQVRPLLASLDAQGLVRHRDGVLSGWLLQPAGRARGTELLATELDTAGERERVLGSYEQFLGLNQELLHVCTDWQLVGGEGSNQINDHSDTAYDAHVVSQLAAIHDKVVPILAELSSALDRFSGYETRLGAALDRVQRGVDGGDDWADWFTKPTIDSYHTVWFELHENLLATLGIERSSEARP